METYITITRIDDFMGVESLRVDQELILKRDLDNRYDDEAIKVVDENDCVCGYVANSVDTVARGTHSAGFVYEKIKDSKCKILFIISDVAIGKII